MKIFNSIKNTGLLLAMGAVFFTACNKLELDPVPNQQPVQGTTPTLATLLDDPNFSYLKDAVKKAGLLPTLSVPTLRFTIFAPDNDAFTRSAASFGLTPPQLIGFLDSATIKSIVSYHVVPQVISSASIPSGFPNFEYPSILNPTTGTPSFNPLVRLSTFPSKRAGGAWVNNIPVTATDIQAVNGVIHKVFAVILPPSFFLWDVRPSTPPLNINRSIFNDPDLTYLKAAITRADSGVAAGGRLVDALTNFGANLTVFAPTDAAMKQFLIGAITKALVDKGFPLALAQGGATAIVNNTGTTLLSNPASIPDIPGIPVVGLGPQLAAVITPTLAKGVVAYHVISAQSGTFAPPGLRVFSVNLPTTATFVKTLVNSAGGPFALHPGVSVQATFVTPAPGISVVATASVKGLANATASNITDKDLHFINGVIHKIDQVLLPQ